jgi:hypothetical protein
VSGPTPSPQVSAAMVPAQLILKGGAGVANFDSECAKIYAAFSPPIVSGTYSSVSSQRQEHVAEHGSNSPYKSQQSEHFVPNSNLAPTFRGEPPIRRGRALPTMFSTINLKGRSTSG